MASIKSGRKSLLWDVPRPATQPCKAIAGSAERVATYAARYERGERLFHAGDNRQVLWQSSQSGPKQAGIRQVSLSDWTAV